MTTEMELGLEIRPGKWDRGIVRTVILGNEYRLPDRFDPSAVIIDIGAHVGAFSRACAARGAGVILSFEPAPENFDLLRRNMVGIRNAHQMDAAVWRSDVEDAELHFGGWRGDDINYGGGNVLGKNGPRVNWVSLDSVIGERWIRFLKIDCEGSEWPILFTSKKLHRVKEIAGEYHEIGGQFNQMAIPEHSKIEGFPDFTIDALTGWLEKHGFRVTHTRCRGGTSNIGLFFARR